MCRSWLLSHLLPQFFPASLLFERKVSFVCFLPLTKRSVAVSSPLNLYSFNSHNAARTSRSQTRRQIRAPPLPQPSSATGTSTRVAAPRTCRAASPRRGRPTGRSRPRRRRGLRGRLLLRADRPPTRPRLYDRQP
ncbi:hypothetical protein DFJ73DRAFT_842595 [Zopfochytrium polystomum]|nr:hypothetical protein DFJ73DRAFT_842595 [Zopfochytrium polystomum]